MPMLFFILLLTATPQLFFRLNNSKFLSLKAGFSAFMLCQCITNQKKHEKSSKQFFKRFSNFTIHFLFYLSLSATQPSQTVCCSPIRRRVFDYGCKPTAYDALLNVCLVAKDSKTANLF